MTSRRLDSACVRRDLGRAVTLKGTSRTRPWTWPEWSIDFELRTVTP